MGCLYLSTMAYVYMCICYSYYPASIKYHIFSNWIEDSDSTLENPSLREFARCSPKNPLATEYVLLSLPCGLLSSLARAFQDYTFPTGQMFSVV